MSRTKAAGKSRKRWVCNSRECDWTQAKGEHVEQPKGTRPSDWECPRCGTTGLTKRMMQLVPGVIDWAEALADLDAKGVVLRGAAADEAPGAYKRLDTVLDYHSDSIRILHRLAPMGVAMAGADTFDPYKD
jgi:tRNA-splicing ligase RtcB